MEQWYCSARLFRALKLPTPRPGPLTPLPLPHTPTHPHPTPTPAPQVWQRRQPGRLGDHQELPVACRRPVLPRAVQPGALGGTGAAAGAGGVWCGRVVRGARAHWTGQNAGRVPLLRRRPQRRCWIYELHLTLIRSRQRTDGTGPPLTPPPPPPSLQPYMYGLDDPKRTRLNASIFNGRKICGVFTPGGLGGAGRVGGMPVPAALHACLPRPSLPASFPSLNPATLQPCTHTHPLPPPAGPGGEEVPAVWVDRTGAKVGVTEQYSRNSKGTLALVAQVRSTVPAMHCSERCLAPSAPCGPPSAARMRNQRGAAAASSTMHAHHARASPPSQRSATARPASSASPPAGDHDARRDRRALQPRHAHDAVWAVRGRRPAHVPLGCALPWLACRPCCQGIKSWSLQHAACQHERSHPAHARACRLPRGCRSHLLTPVLSRDCLQTRASTAWCLLRAP